MDGKGKSVSRDWEFSDNPKDISSASLPGHNASEHQTSFLRMGLYNERNHMMIQPNLEIPMMNYPWVSQRNFLSDLRNVTPLRARPLNSKTVEIPVENGEIGSEPSNLKKQHASNKRANGNASKSVRAKEPKTIPKKKKESATSNFKREKKNLDNIEEGDLIDYSSVPAPVCSCTGVSRQCYRWGAGGWQSSCCTTNVSVYPLPMSTSRPGARMAGRKMSISAYGKLLHRLASEGHDLSFPVDLKTHWARHGTNKFVTIRALGASPATQG